MVRKSVHSRGRKSRKSHVKKSHVKKSHVKKSHVKKSHVKKSHVKKSHVKKSQERKSLEKVLHSLPRTRVSRIKKLLQEIKKSANARGSVTRGWAAMAPQKGKERKELLHKCGSKCFLELTTLGYPICPALRANNNCKINCKGLIAAKIRASQYKNKYVLAKVDNYIRKNCGPQKKPALF